MEGDDYKSLLLGYFTKFDNRVSEGYLKMFVLASIGYLARTVISSAPSTTTTAVLEKMISAAELMSHRQKCRDIHGPNNAGDREWIRQLYRERRALSESYCQLFRRLLHAFVTSYLRGVLTGDQDEIRNYLHTSLEAAHAERTCEVPECPWVSHQCPRTWNSDYIECPLLVTGEDITLEPALAANLPGAHTDDDDTSVPTPSTGSEPDAHSAQLMNPGLPVIAQAAARPSHLPHLVPLSSPVAVHARPRKPAVSMNLTDIEVRPGLQVHQPASPAHSDASPQPSISPSASPESPLASDSVQISAPARPLSGREGEPGELLSGRESPADGPVAAQQASSVSAAAETPGHRGDVLGEALAGARSAAGDGPTHHGSPPPTFAQNDRSPSVSLHEGTSRPAGPTMTDIMAPGRIMVSDDRQGSESSHGPPVEHLIVDEGARREERAIYVRQAGGDTERTAVVLFPGDMTAGGQGTEEFELVTRGDCDTPGQGSGGLEPDE